MRHANRQNDKLIVPDIVHDAVVPNTEPSQAPQVAFQHGAEMRSFRQPVDGRNDPRPIRLRHTPQLFGGALFNPYREAHA